MKERSRQPMIVSSVGFLCLFVALVTLLRPLLVTQELLFTLLGVINTVMAGLCYLYLRQSAARPWHGALPLYLVAAMLLPLLAVNGGITSHFILLLPLLPVWTALLLNARKGILVALLAAIVVLALIYFAPILPYSAHHQVSDSFLLLHGLWLILALGLSARIGVLTERYVLQTRSDDDEPRDPLTGLLTRRAVVDKVGFLLGESQEQGDWLTAMLVDVDHLKQLNQRYSHADGDQLLRALSQALLARTRQGKDALGRYTSKQFLLLLPGVDQGRAHGIADKLCSDVAEHTYMVDEIPLQTTLSIGYCSLPASGLHDPEHLLHETELALKAAKQAGGNQVVGAEQSLMVNRA
ncbi:diguanylate cyclase [Aestuariibacter halophilus]|uniref:diguanylate cyclase n=1 Tax=Fluctibacter halophilus TaxID=226011 RepID=A0ABS8G796_9ALTE|nr:diguanylate cyclase [Aestuariibacter halophilus]MCC2616354.1 diguanylate cyclase [Aestuariibacter halophilus]